MDLAEEHPVAVARLGAHLLPEAHRPLMHCGKVEGLVRCLAKSPGTRCDLLTVCNELARLGCPTTLSLEALVAHNGGDLACPQRR